MAVFYKAKKVIYEASEYFDVFLGVEDKKVTGVFRQEEIPAGASVVNDYEKDTIAPGFVDVHVHGIAGADVMDCKAQSNKTIAYQLAKLGVTSYLPTTLTASVEKLNDAIKGVVEFVESEEYQGQCAKIRGIFLEGPFFTEKYKGAQNPAYFIDPKKEIVEDWQHIAKGIIKKVSLAPEREGSTEFIKSMTQMDIKVAIGHSDATFEQANEAIEAGANTFVHLFNGMSPLNHRLPGMAGAGLLSDERVYCEMICDGLHMHPATAKLIYRNKGADNSVLITDCMMAGHMPEGKYMLGEFEVQVKDGAARLASGNLAGSTLLMKDAVKNLVTWGICSELEAINMASYSPAKSAGVDDVCGILKEGREADFVVLNPDLELVQVFIDGEKVPQSC